MVRVMHAVKHMPTPTPPEPERITTPPGLREEQPADSGRERPESAREKEKTPRLEDDKRIERYRER